MDANQGQDPERAEETVKMEVKASGETARILNLLAFLMNQAPVKAAFITISRSAVKSDEKYTGVLARLVSLLNVVADWPSHTAAQESIVVRCWSVMSLNPVGG